MTKKKDDENQAEQANLVPVEVETDVVDVPTEEELFLQESAAAEDKDLRPVILSIGQKDENAGKIWCEKMKLAVDSISFVVLKRSQSRCLYPKPFNPKNKPICHSLDGKIPVADLRDEDGNALTPMCDSCERIPGKRQYKCQYAKWGKGTSPECFLFEDLLILDLDDYGVKWFPFKSTGLKPLKENLTDPLDQRVNSLTNKRAMSGIRTPGHTCMFRVTMTTVKEEFPSGPAYLPVFSTIEEVPDDTKNIMAHIAMKSKDIVRQEEYTFDDDDETDEADDKQFGEESAEAPF